MRVKYEIAGTTYVMRTFTGRDIARVTGRLAILPMGDGTSGVPAWKANEIADGLLVACSRSPRITLDEAEEIPEGTLPVSEIPDAVYLELVANLSRDSGFSAEAAEAIRPTSATGEDSSPLTP